MSDAWVWNQYWHYDRIASCFDGAGATNYDESVAAGWRVFFATLAGDARIIDLCTGNGAAALIAAQAGAFAITAVDRADIDPPAFVTRHAADFVRIRFIGATNVEALPFPDASFDAAISQYGIEYSDLARALPELVRVLAPGGRARLVVHAADGIVAASARAVMAEANLLLESIDLPGAARRCFERVSAAERSARPSAAAKAGADESFAAFQAALERTARAIPTAEDKTMFKNSGAVFLDTFRRRGHFDVAQLLAKVDAVDTEILAHRGRLKALVEAALDAPGADALAAALCGAGAAEATSTPLANADGLIAYVVEARF